MTQIDPLTLQKTQYIAAPCLASAGTNKDKLRQCIASWKGQLFAVPGEAYFDKTGQLIQQSVLVEVGKGAFQAFKGK